MKFTRALMVVVAVLAFAGSGYLMARATTPKADPRPQAGTIACRDAQIALIENRPIRVGGPYSASNEVVASVLAVAVELQAVCR